MQKTILTLALCAIAAVAHAHVSVKDAWARATTPSQKASAAYGVFNNHNEGDKIIVSASSPVAKRTELHTHKMDEHGRMIMSKVDSILIPAGHEVALQPGGLHIMLIHLNRTLELGTDVPITLTFKDGTTKLFRATVRPLSYRPQPTMEHPHE